MIQFYHFTCSERDSNFGIPMFSNPNNYCDAIWSGNFKTVPRLFTLGAGSEE